MIRQTFLKINVVDATRKRIEWIFDNFDNIVVSISGGKDSTVLAYMTLQEAHKRNRKVGIFFLDEEVVYQSTIDQVRYIMNLYPENTIKLWYQLEFNLTNATSIDETQFKVWDHEKQDVWLRPKEEDSIKQPTWNVNKQTIANKKKGFGFYDALDNFQLTYENTAYLIGLRASESLNRWRAVIKNPGIPNIYWSTKRPQGNFQMYPLYDWNFQDIWKFLYENNIRYSKIYDYQYKKGLGMKDMRVSSLIHERAFKSLVELPEFEPQTYDKLMARTKGIQVGNIYGKDDLMLKCRKLPKNYDNWIQYRDFLLSTIKDESIKQIFTKRFSKQLNNNYVARQQCKQLILNDYENNLPINNREDEREKKLNYWKGVLYENN
jgi:predicted phosphoadenosine phosphosulfate sulfurtransferase|nr:MAG TPA: phosphoadenosine-phosphosulfate reductase [Caudoviricetes sp.]